MRKLIINVCKYIIAKLESCDDTQENLEIKRKAYSPRKYPEGVKRSDYHKGCWVITDSNQHFYRTQQSAADAVSEMFNADIRRSDINNALRRNGELIVGGKTLCLIAYEL